MPTSLPTPSSPEEPGLLRVRYGRILTEIALSIGSNCALLDPSGVVIARADPVGAFNPGALHPTCRYFGEICLQMRGEKTSAVAPCEAGCLFLAAPLKNRGGETEATLLAGPLALTDTVRCPKPEPGVCTPVRRATRARADALAHLLQTMAASLAELSLAEKLEGEKLFAARVELASHLRALRRADSPEEYPLSLENSLSEAIASRDAARAKSLASRLLSHVLLAKERSGGGTPARLFELLTVISRAALKAGADPSYVLKRNADAMSGLMRLYGEDKRAEELSTWLSSLLDSYFAVIGEAVSPRHRELIGAVRNYLLEHYAGKVSLEDAAAVAEVTPTYLSKVFKAETGVSFVAYLNGIRIEQAKFLLLSSDASLKEIAEATGFGDQSYFTKIFRLSTGVSPGKYRKSAGAISG
ncbi:MAG: helix-turn-helix transcriptional regulator [Clostridia bacterium]|nr:helix-turn-helix transcriptional regulator [Clostridia bacterium]